MGFKKSHVILFFLVQIVLSIELNYNFDIPQPPSDDYYYDWSYNSEYDSDYKVDASANTQLFTLKSTSEAINSEPTTTSTKTTTSTTSTKLTSLIFKKIEFIQTTSKITTILETKSAKMILENSTLFIVIIAAIVTLFVLMSLGVFLVVRIKRKKNKRSHESSIIDKNQYISVNQAK